MQITMDVTATELNMIQDLLFGRRLKIRTTDNNAALIISTFRSIVNKKRVYDRYRLQKSS